MNLDYIRILEALRENVRDFFGEVFDRQLLESSIFAVEVENKNYEQEDEEIYKEILLNYLDNLYFSLKMLNTNFLKKEIMNKLKAISEKSINDILIVPGDFDLEMTKEMFLSSEIKELESKIKVFLNLIKEVRSDIDNPPDLESPRNENKGPEGPGGL